MRPNPPDPVTPAAAARPVELADLTTLGVGGPVAEMVVAGSRDETVAAVAEADRTGRPVLVLGAGSNVLAGDAGFDGLVVQPAATGRSVTTEDGWVEMTVEAGETWSRLVEQSVAEDLAGIECLAAIPGSVGAVPVQNVGAYGEEVSATIRRVEAYDRQSGRTVSLDGPACRFGYRTSMFKTTDRYVILAVTFRLRRSDRSDPVRYGQLADTLGVSLGDRVPLAEAHDAVVGLRRSKGMVLDPDDLDTRSAGSFFTNPLLDDPALAGLRSRAAERLGPDVAIPVFPDGDRHKVPAAWLVEQAGFTRGYQQGDAAISTKHTLALTVRRGRRAEPLLALARTVRDTVGQTFGVTLVPEPTLVGVTL